MDLLALDRPLLRNARTIKFCIILLFYWNLLLITRPIKANGNSGGAGSAEIFTAYLMYIADIAIFYQVSRGADAAAAEEAVEQTLKTECAHAFLK